MSTIKLIALDLDGTLLNHTHHVSDYTKKVWKKVQDLGIYILPVTGRPRKGMVVSVPYDICDYSINSNGVHIFKNENGNADLIWDKSMEWEVVNKVLSFLDKEFSDLHVQVYSEGDNLYTRSENDFTAEYYSRAGIEFTIIDEWNDIQGKKYPKIMVLADHEILLPVQEKFATWKEINAVFSMPMYLEIFAREASKGNALLHLGEVLGIDASEMLGVGDSYNDLPMLETCGISYVMKNANEKVAPHLPRTKFDNNNDGAAKLIEEILGL